MHGRDMRETNITDNSNCKTQAYARACKEKKLELEFKGKNHTY